MLPGTKAHASLTLTISFTFSKNESRFAECAEIFRLKIYLPCKTAKRASSETEFSEHP